MNKQAKVFTPEPLPPQQIADALTAPLKWTRALPTEEGWYWYRAYMHTPGIYFFCRRRGPLGEYDAPGDCQYEQALPLERDDNPNREEEWAGPIPAPI